MKKELIWVEKEFAEKYNEYEKDETLNEERLKVLNDYMETVKEKVKRDFKISLETMEEDFS